MSDNYFGTFEEKKYNLLDKIEREQYKRDKKKDERICRIVGIR